MAAFGTLPGLFAGFWLRVPMGLRLRIQAASGEHFDEMPWPDELSPLQKLCKAPTQWKLKYTHMYTRVTCCVALQEQVCWGP